MAKVAKVTERVSDSKIQTTIHAQIDSSSLFPLKIKERKRKCESAQESFLGRALKTKKKQVFAESG